MTLPDDAYETLRGLIKDHAQPHFYPQRGDDGAWILKEAPSIREMWGDYHAHGKSSRGADGAELRFALANSVPTQLMGPWYEDHVFGQDVEADDIDEALGRIVMEALRVAVPAHWDADIGGQDAIITRCYESAPGRWSVILQTGDLSRIDGPVADLGDEWAFENADPSPSAMQP